MKTQTSPCSLTTARILNLGVQPRIKPIENSIQTLWDDPLQPFLDSFTAVQTSQRMSVWDKNGAAAPSSACARLFAVPVLQKWGAESTLPGWGLPKLSLHVKLTSARYWPDTAACTSVSDPSPTGSSETQRTRHRMSVECKLCAFTHAETHFTWKEHRFCFCSASGFSPRALPGQTLAANRSSMLLSGNTL